MEKVTFLPGQDSLHASLGISDERMEQIRDTFNKMVIGELQNTGYPVPSAFLNNMSQQMELTVQEWIALSFMVSAMLKRIGIVWDPANKREAAMQIANSMMEQMSDRSIEQSLQNVMQ